MDVNLDGNTITNGYFSGIGEDLLELDADNITSGTLDDARLSALVALLNVANTWTAPQAIAALANLTTNGFIKTTSGDGTLVVDTSSYIVGPIAVTGDAVGSGTTSIPVTVEGINGTSLAGLATGLLKNTTTTGVPSIASANDVAASLTGTTGTVDLSGGTVTLPTGSVTVSDIDATGTPSSSTYLRGDGMWASAGGGTISLTGDAVGSGTSSIPVTVEGINGTSLAGLATGLLKNTTSTGVPSIASANDVAAGLTGTTGTLDLSGSTLTLPTLSAIHLVALATAGSNLGGSGTPGAAGSGSTVNILDQRAGSGGNNASSGAGSGGAGGAFTNSVIKGGAGGAASTSGNSGGPGGAALALITAIGGAGAAGNTLGVGGTGGATGTITLNGGNGGASGTSGAAGGPGGVGGTIQANGGNGGANAGVFGGAAGTLRMNGGNATSVLGYIAGSIDTSSQGRSSGGSITTTGGLNATVNTAAGGSINTGGSTAGFAGGSIATNAGSTANGGSINTANGGGSIDTTGNGSIGFGIAANLITLVGTSGAGGKTQTMRAATGTLSLDATLTSNTTSTITFNSTGNDETIYNTSSSTIASATITLPTSSRPGQIVRYVTAGQLTAITMAGGTQDIGATLTTLPANSSVAWQSDVSGHWVMLSGAGEAITLTGDATGSGDSSIPTTVTGINGTSMAGLSTGLLKNTTSTGVPSIASANDVASTLTGTTDTIDLSLATLTLPAASVEISNIDATGTPGSTTYLRGDGTWFTPSGGGGGTTTPLLDSFGNPVVDVSTGVVVITDDQANGITGWELVSGGAGFGYPSISGNSSALTVVGTLNTQDISMAGGSAIVGPFGTFLDGLIVGSNTTILPTGTQFGIGTIGTSAPLAAFDVSSITSQRIFQYPDAAGTFALRGDALTEFILTGFTLPEANGGTGGTAGAISRAVLTTLGDILYGAGAGNPTRLAGNTSSTLAVLTQTGTGSVSAAPAWSTAPSLIITGVSTNSSAAAGKVGEIISSAVASGSAVSLTTATPANVTSISLTAGDWDVEGNVNFADASATMTGTVAGISTTSATLPTDGTEVYSGLQLVTASATDSVTLPRTRISISSTTTVYLVGQQTFSAGTADGFGSITARRVR